jgi:hypothetical protein
MEPVIIILLITTVSNLALQLIGHVKRSSCFGISMETESISFNKQ